MDIVYIGFCLPPDLTQRFPKLMSAGQLWETRLLQNLGIGSGSRMATILDRKIKPTDADRQDPFRLLLEAKFGKDLQVYPSFLELRKTYLAWRKQGWKPDYCLVYNTHPIGNAFVRFLAEHDPDVKRVLFFLDSRHFGTKLGRLKRLRFKLKPLNWRDEEMLPYFHGVAAASFSSKQFCQDRSIPWYWFPGGAQADGLLDKVVAPSRSGNKRIGYFGSHSDYAGLAELIDTLLRNPALPITLSIAGEGQQTAELKKRSASDRRIQWVGFFDNRSDLGHWASRCHALVNPRPARYGNENNFPSKVFDYLQLARPVLSSITPTLKHAFGDSMIWYDAANPHALQCALMHVATKSTAELMQEGQALREGYLARYYWHEIVPPLRKWMQELQCR